MVDTILLGSDTPHFVQTQKHQDTFVHLSWVISAHQVPYENFLAETNKPIPVPTPLSPHIVTNMSDLGVEYKTWWSSFRRHLTTHSRAHQSMAGLLKGAVNEFYRIDAV